MTVLSPSHLHLGAPPRRALHLNLMTSRTSTKRSDTYHHARRPHASTAEHVRWSWLIRTDRYVVSAEE